jgi:large subunit ribosomal protein L31e
MAEKPKTEKKAAPKAEPGLKKEGGSAAFRQVEDKVMVIPLRHQSRKSAKNMRKNRAIREIRAFLARHMRTEPSKVMISQQLNEYLWKAGLHNTPAKIKVRVSTDEEGKVTARLLEEKEKPGRHIRKKSGLMDRLSRRKTEGKSEPAKEEKPAAKPVPPKPEEKKPEPKPEEKPAPREGILEEDMK